jgi:hypothetical protein
MLLRAGALDLASKFEAAAALKARGEEATFPGLPIPLREREASSPKQVEAVQLMLRAEAFDTPALHYSLACIWVRDALLRPSKNDQAFGVAAFHLMRAVEDPSYAARWRNDPDLKNSTQKLISTNPELEKVP